MADSESVGSKTLGVRVSRRKEKEKEKKKWASDSTGRREAMIKVRI